VIDYHEGVEPGTDVTELDNAHSREPTRRASREVR
jgi:hypothetical protein